MFAAADRLRREVCGDEVSYVVTRNIQYTNVCYFRCGFCAFSKGKLAANLRGAPLSRAARGDRPPRAARRGSGARPRSASRAASIPAFTGDYYADPSSRRSARELPDLHIHAFSALEIWQGAATLGLPLEDYLARLRALGLGSLPGTAAEILDDEVRARHLPRQGHDRAVAGRARGRAPGRAALERDDHVRARRAAASTGRAICSGRASSRSGSGGFTELVPLPFVHMEAPMWLKGLARSGPTFGETLLLHAVARLALHPRITNIQASWVKLGPDGVAAALARGRQRPRRHADERVDLALGRLRARAGDGARGDGGADPRERPRFRASGRRSTGMLPPSGAPPRSGPHRSPSRSTRPSAMRG